MPSISASPPPTPAFTQREIKKIAHLARIHLTDEELALYAQQLSSILHFADHMAQADTSQVSALANPLHTIQRLRPDQVTESDQHRLFQSIAPQVTAGLYLVPPVIQDNNNPTNKNNEEADVQ